MTILFAQGIHRPDDDRVFYHQKATLEQHGYSVHILSWVGVQMSFCKHVRHIHSQIKAHKPDVVICDTPKTVIASVGCGARIIYDITEWYPGHVALGTRNLLTPFKWLAMCGLSALAGCIADSFIFGEKDKGRPFRRWFSWKRYIEMPYYPSLRFFPKSVSKDISKTCNLIYAGPFTAEKGWERVQQMMELCRAKRPDVTFNLIALDPEHYLPLPEFCCSLNTVHIGLDLRDIDRETNRCLPIKIFYYMAAGCACVYSHLNAIPKGIPEVSSFARLVTTPKEASDAVIHFLDHDAFKAASCAARTLFEQKYNWETIAPRLIALLKS